MYGVLAWPPDDLMEWMRRLQKAYGVKGYGSPHLNLRQPFKWRWSQEALRRGVEGILRGHQPFRVKLGGWGVFDGKGVVYLRAYGGSAFDRLYQSLEPLAPPEAEIEGPSYIPHLTLALDLERDAAEALARKLPPPPRKSFTISEVALVEDDDGDFVELARFPLGPVEK